MLRTGWHCLLDVGIGATNYGRRFTAMLATSISVPALQQCLRTPDLHVAEWGHEDAFPNLQLLDLSYASVVLTTQQAKANVSASALGGTLPPSWGENGAWPYLTTLNLMSNNFTGPLPSEWGEQLLNLTFLDVSFNEFLRGVLSLQPQDSPNSIYGCVVNAISCFCCMASQNSLGPACQTFEQHCGAVGCNILKHES